MRQIKFRAWHKGAKEMLFGTNENIFRWQAEGQPIELMQFIGLKDKNGKEIYEGDIDQDGGKVFYNESMASFQIDYGEKADVADVQDVDTWMIVFGNIYENPDLLSA